MQRAKTILWIIAAILILLAFLSWRFDFKFILSFGYYFLVGIILVVLLIWGRIIAPFVIFGSALPFVIAMIVLILSKSATWSSVYGTNVLLLAVSGVATGTLFYMIGSETVEQEHEARSAHAKRDVVCAKCEQFLGKAAAFKSPCPKCGSNRYKFED